MQKRIEQNSPPFVVYMNNDYYVNMSDTYT